MSDALVKPFLNLPLTARTWWLLTVCASIGLAPLCLSQTDALNLPVAGLVLVTLLNGVLVIATAQRRQQSTFLASFDYGGIATLALLASFGPAAAMCAFVGEKAAGAFLPDASGQRPGWVRSVFNLAWGSPCILLSWALRGLAHDRTLEPLVIAAAWWLSNGVLVGTMVTLAQRRSAWDGLRLIFVHDGWLRLQEGALSVLAVVVLWTNPWLLLVVVLLVIGHAMTGQQLFVEYERGAAAREQAAAERRRAELEAEQARMDPLTRLANRRAFEEALERRPSLHAVLMLDLDHFKRVNDDFGHDVGDQVLVEVAATLVRTLGEQAFCARLGGEEFCALLPPTLVANDDALLGLAERVRYAVLDLRFAGHDELCPTVSIGAARRGHGELTVREAITRADQALYAAKRHGRNRTYLEAPADVAPRQLIGEQRHLEPSVLSQQRGALDYV